MRKEGRTRDPKLKENEDPTQDGWELAWRRTQPCATSGAASQMGTRGRAKRKDSGAREQDRKKLLTGSQRSAATGYIGM